MTAPTPKMRLYQTGDTHLHPCTAIRVDGGPVAEHPTARAAATCGGSNWDPKETEPGTPQYGKLFEQQDLPGPGHIGGVNRAALPPSMYS